MKRSESSYYTTYMRAKTDNRHRAALSAYLEFIDEQEDKMIVAERLASLQDLGVLFYNLGDRGVAEYFFKVAFDGDPNSLRLKLGRARFLCREVGNYQEALEICEFVLKSTENESDNGPAHLQARFARELKEEIGELVNSADG